MSANDYLVIGSGTAGLTYALDVAKHGKVTVLSKLNLEEGNTLYAQGGIASVIDSKDTFEDHISDTLTAGAGLCKEDIVRFVVEQGPSAIEYLINQDVRFDIKESNKNSKEEFSLGKEGGHNNRRILHWGDSTGAEIQRALVAKAVANPNINLLPNHTAIDLIIDKTSQNHRITGAYAFDEKNNQIITLGAKITCIATGGIGKVYKYTSNPNVATGDGIAIAHRAGAEIKNMEFIQFHPTCLYHSQANSFLITEAMRGEGALLKRKDGTCFMENYHELKELAPRDIVARAIDYELKSTGEDYVLLDITHQSEEFLKKRFPKIYTFLLSLGINISKDQIPVVPAAHYSCGGIAVDRDGKTNLSGLYAAGEATFTGLHGANRLASNSLLEAVVYGRSAARSSIKEIKKIKELKILPKWDSLDTKTSKEVVLVSHLWDEVRLIMWNLVGIVRSNLRLELAKRRLEIINNDVNSYYWKYKIDRDLLELRNIVEIALLVVDSSLLRKESRGLHYNIDYPETNSNLSQSDTLLKL
jgi:L-aspartate oxidase